MMFNEDMTKLICKIGGPFILLFCLPGVIWAFRSMVERETLNGNPLTTKALFIMIIFVVLLLVGGLFFTFKGYEDKFRK